jgi:hypothetical protein
MRGRVSRTRHKSLTEAPGSLARTAIGVDRTARPRLRGRRTGGCRLPHERSLVGCPMPGGRSLNPDLARERASSPPRICPLDCLNAECRLLGQGNAANLRIDDRFGMAGHRIPIVPRVEWPLLQFQGHTAVEPPVAARGGLRHPGAPGRGAYRPPDRPARRLQQGHRHSISLCHRARLALAALPRDRSIENAGAIVEEARRRVDADGPLLLTSDEYPATGRPSSRPSASRCRRRGDRGGLGSSLS